MCSNGWQDCENRWVDGERYQNTNFTKKDEKVVVAT